MYAAEHVDDMNRRNADRSEIVEKFFMSGKESIDAET